MGCDDMAMAKVVLASVFFDFFIGLVAVDSGMCHGKFNAV